jgi:hypothetical protein
MLIAGDADEPQVFFNGLAASGLGNYMIDGQLITGDALIGSAVTAMIACRAGHSLAQAGRYARFAGSHGLSSASIGIRWPRCLRRRYA